jgi:ATP-dependent DNA ligase
MEARSAESLPRTGEWFFEPKWDGFRCLAFRAGETIVLQSKSGQPLGRYFPELVAALGALRPSRFVLDGEIVIASGHGVDFDALLQRIHPAASRIAKLAEETPASYQVFDLLVDARGTSLLEQPLAARRERLERFSAAFPADGNVQLSPGTPDRATATRWLEALASLGLDGVIAKRLDAAYLSGERNGMVKVKRLRTADCVVGGFRWAQGGQEIGSLLLGLYDDEGHLDHVGFCASFTAAERAALDPIVLPVRGEPGFTGRAPGGPSRWSSERSAEWQSLRPELVCEVRYDHFSGGRFRHGTKFLRWRPDKAPSRCTFEQVHGQRKRSP